MNTWHLRYFVDAANAGKLSDAASKNRVTLSAVSQAIRALEADLGVQLLHHGRRRFELTEEGRWLVERSHAVLGGLAQLRDDISTAAREPSGELIIAAPQSLVGLRAWKALKILRRKYPQVRVKLLTGAAAQVRAWVETHQCHVGLLLDDGRTGAFASRVLFEGDFVVVGRESPKATDRIIVTDATKPEVLHLAKALQRGSKTKVEWEMEIVSWSLIRNLVLEGLGVGYVPDYVVEKELRSKRLRRIPQPGKPYRYQIKALWPTAVTLTRNAELFLSAMSEAL